MVLEIRSIKLYLRHIRLRTPTDTFFFMVHGLPIDLNVLPYLIDDFKTQSINSVLNGRCKT